MAYQRLTYLCYDNSFLIRDGVIPRSITRTWDRSDFNLNRLKNPAKGVTYKVIKDETGNITSIQETKKLLPASKIKVEIDFSKVMKNAVSHPITPTSIPGFAGALITPMFAPIGFGGITSGTTEITFHVLETAKKINKKIIVDQNLKNTGIWESVDGYPLSVFGIVKEHREIIQGKDEEELSKNKDKYKKDHPQASFIIDSEGQTIAIVGIDFKSDDFEILGKYSDGSSNGSARKRIKGSTDSNGLYGGIGTPDVKFNEVIFSDQQQLFLEIIQDDRVLKFRADNESASGDKGYPPRVNEPPHTDATTKKIRIKRENLSVGDAIYITYEVATSRYLRQILSHLGKIAQGNTYGIVGFVGAISSVVDAYNYKLFSWKVSNRSDFKLNLTEYNTKYENNDNSSYEKAEEVEGWRLSESISRTNALKTFFGADHRGIWRYDSGSITILLAREDIRDQDWFNSYLTTLYNDYVYSPTYIDIESRIDPGDLAGLPFDISEVVNTLLYDTEKIPYYRPFAKALASASKFSKEDDKKGIGVLQLDLIGKMATSDSTLEMYDLSFSDFSLMNAQPSKNKSCDTPSDITPDYYWSQNYDSANDQPWTMYSSDYIENSLFEWRPPGGTIESYWKVETPYFCGDFPERTSVYIERMGGTSLDNFSWIYVDTEPFIPHNITSDRSYYSDISMVVFQDNNVHNSLCYHYFSGFDFSKSFLWKRKDETKSHERDDEYNYETYKDIGFNRLLGCSPSYSYGVPITYDTSKVCSDKKYDEFWFTKDFINDPDKSNYGLDFSEDVPELTINEDWYIRRMIIEYSFKNMSEIDKLDIPVGLYFESQQASIEQIYLFSKNLNSQGRVTAEIFVNYYGGPVKFLGEFWKKVNIHKLEAVIHSPSSSNNTSGLNIEDYKITEGQSSVVLDGMGKIIVFYANTESGNIDAAVSSNDGRKWFIHRSLIRLIDGETASLPMAIKNRSRITDQNSVSGGTANVAMLFYILNDSYVMCKQIQLDLFYEEDAFIVPNVPDSYKVGDYDFSIDNPDAAYWSTQLSSYGLSLRRTPSYFVVGSTTEDPFFDDQMAITKALHNEYQSNLDPNDPASNQPYKVQYARFEYSGAKSNLQDRYNGSSFGLHIDHQSVIRLFFVSNDKLSIKSSTDFYTWAYDVKEAEIHKIYADDEKNEGIDRKINNIQIVQNDYDAISVPLLYFNNDMLFVRYLDISILYPVPSSGEVDRGDLIRQSLEISGHGDNNPIFLMGSIPETIKNIKLDELNNKTKVEDSALLIIFPYTKSMIEKMDEKFGIDSATQPYGFTYKDGLERIFYKDTYGNLNGLVLNGRRDPNPECMLI